MIKYILTDIEGTTTSIAFVNDVLFPYFINNFETFAKTNEDKVAVIFGEKRQKIFQQLGIDLNFGDLIQDFLISAERDLKETSLKNLQGIVWKEAYESGKIKSHVYNDVPDVLRFWKVKGIELGVYSSGSVEAQKLLFAHTKFGDLTPFFTHYFDTNMGSKRETKSYVNIQKAIYLDGTEILFLSDIEQELDAAQMAGFQTIQLVREGTIASTKHKTAKDFNEVNSIAFNNAF